MAHQDGLASVRAFVKTAKGLSSTLAEKAFIFFCLKTVFSCVYVCILGNNEYKILTKMKKVKTYLPPHPNACLPLPLNLVPRGATVRPLEKS